MRKYLFAMCLMRAVPVFAVDASDFSGMEGWSVAAVTRVEDEFEGCDVNRKIKFGNNWVLTCSNSSNSSSSRPGAVIFVKSFNLEGRSYWMVKALIQEKFYDMETISAK